MFNYTQVDVMNGICMGKEEMANEMKTSLEFVRACPADQTFARAEIIDFLELLIARAKSGC